MRVRRSILTGVVVGGIALAAAGCSSSGSGAKVTRTPNSIVLDAVHSAQGQRTAIVQLSLSSAGLPAGSNEGGIGFGQVDFDTGAMTATFDYSGNPRIQGLQLTELIVGGHLYIALSQNGQSVPSLLPGKEWIANPGNLDSELTGSGSQNPADIVGALAAKGNTVVDIGPSAIDGMATEEYSVTSNPAQALTKLSQEHLPASIVKGAKALISAGPVQMKVWVNQSSDVIRQLTMGLPVSGEKGATVTVTMDFSDYGAPVSISPPPASTVATYGQFEQAAKAAQSIPT